MQETWKRFVYPLIEDKKQDDALGLGTLERGDYPQAIAEDWQQKPHGT